MNPVQLAVRVLRFDRRSRISALLTAIGVAMATALITFLATLPHATEVRSEREQWQTELVGTDEGISSEETNAKGTDAVRTVDFIGNTEILRLDTAGRPTPPEDGPRLPGPGQVLLSPKLAELAKNLPSEQLGDRFAGTPVGLIDEQHLRYPEQLVAVVGHPQGALDGMSNGSGAVREQDDTLLVLLAWVGIVLLSIPSLVLVASASRLTAARRERRLAAVRLAGGTPGQVVASVAAEIAIASVGGTLLGIVLGWPLRYVFRNVPWDGGTWLVSDFTPSIATIGIVGAGIPVLVVLAAVFGLRRVVRAPLGAAMEHSRKRPKAWRLLALVAVGVLFAYGIKAADDGGGIAMLIGALAAVVLSASIVGPWVTSAIGSIFTRMWQRPAALLAGRRLVSDPKSAYRAASGVVLAVFVGSMTLTLLPGFESLSGGGYAYRDSVLYARVPSDKADGIKQRVTDELERRGTDATTSTSVLANVKGSDQGIDSALVMDCTAAKASTRFAIGSCDGPPSARIRDGMTRPTEVSGYGGDAAVPLPPDVRTAPLDVTDSDVEETALIDPALVPELMSSAENVVTVAPAAESDREAARTALALAAPGIETESRELMLSEQQTMLSDLRRVAVIGVSISALLAGCSAAITAAASVVDRRRTLGALIAAGTPVRVLSRALRTEAALPAMVATVGAGIGGVTVGFGLLSLFDAEQQVNPWIGAPIVLGVLVALLAASACGPVLRKVSAEPLSDE